MIALDTKPGTGEHPAYAALYVNTAADALLTNGSSSLLSLLASQPAALHALVAGVQQDELQRAYAPGKWTLAESLVHVADTERVFAYRMMRIARGDQTPLPGFDQDAWVPESRASRRATADILTEIEAVRAATLALVRSFDDQAVLQSGISGGNPVTARGLAWMIAGHFAHHLEITRTRYLGGA